MNLLPGTARSVMCEQICVIIYIFMEYVEIILETLGPNSVC